MSTAQLVQTVATLYASSDCAVAALTILVYDCVLSFAEELSCIWHPKRRISAASLIYTVSRYVTIISYAVSAATINPMTPLSCEATLWMQNVAFCLSTLAPPVFSTIRVYALSGRSKVLTALTLLLSLVTPITSMATFVVFSRIEYLPSPFNCSVVQLVSPQESFRYTMSSRACTLAADAIVVFVTWWNTYKSYKIQQEAEIGSSLARVMLWNGSLYFIVLAGLSIVHIALTALEIDAIFIDDSYANPFIYPISSILVCHFLLNLRQVDVDPASESHSQSMSADDLRFAAVSAGTLPRFIASLGEPVHVYEPESVDAIYDASDEGALDDLVRTQAGDCVADQGDRLGSITEETG